MARKTKERAIQSPGITIIGEGLTERYYFTHLKRLKGYRYTCKPRNFTEQSIEDIQKQVERVLADRGVAVCVFDADVARAKPAEKAKLDAMRKKYANRENVVICDSMPSIEFWFLIHFLNTNKYFASSRDVYKCFVATFQISTSMTLSSPRRNGWQNYLSTTVLKQPCNEQRVSAPMASRIATFTKRSSGLNRKNSDSTLGSLRSRRVTP